MRRGDGIFSFLWIRGGRWFRWWRFLRCSWRICSNRQRKSVAVGWLFCLLFNVHWLNEALRRCSSVLYLVQQVIRSYRRSWPFGRTAVVIVAIEALRKCRGVSLVVFIIDSWLTLLLLNLIIWALSTAGQDNFPRRCSIDGIKGSQQTLFNTRIRKIWSWLFSTDDLN